MPSPYPSPRTYAAPRGLLDRTVTLQQWSADSDDDAGHPTGTWETAAAVYANVIPLSGRWAEYARQFCEQATYRVLINYRSDVTSRTWRVVVGSMTLNVLRAVNVDQRNHTLELLCSETQ